jgi:hypothetical protein
MVVRRPGHRAEGQQSAYAGLPAERKKILSPGGERGYLAVPGPLLNPRLRCLGPGPPERPSARVPLG